ncbi:MAG: 16S rRNA (cytosine(1402)-N(4))-methyltransferase RsmH [Cloacibacillus porcorum]|uniref:16S rRNA (cytosine(1402)-N(4))-methyltransferase RsmH n=1 Tax=Cloacibacillus porcorum TaxID=1197717 RepID=UPI0023F40579|nr:16S rRNA (cytosine(1402)-N(4))-methyltransferase RsmH [Cloacibacillus porcorum]MCD7875430.1 16S rRNA (cytosine(1402)-N(4))-methyltransferase RsmH [Cloacibacillus porcorum]
MREHQSVMLNEVLDAVGGETNVRTVVDATLGLAGHSIEILKRHPEAFLYGFDQDAEAREIAAERLAPFAPRFEIIADNFRNIGLLKEIDGFRGADAVLFDLGVSNLQISEPERGFSFQYDGPLDMRMDAGDEESSHPKAEEILRTAGVKELTEIFRDYGEERYAFQIAKGIVRHREHGGELHSTTELVELIRKILPAPVQRKMGGHPARKVFQALRIAVNDEMNALSEALDGAAALLNPEGKIIVISYHSLEDRMVKHRFRKWKEEELGEPNPRKALLPAEDEVEANYKSRSAKLRIFEKYEEDEKVEDEF